MSEKQPVLPPPVQAAGPVTPGRARFASLPAASNGRKIKVHWARLRQRIGTASADAPSDSFGEDTLDGSSNWRRASSHPGSQTPWNAVGGHEDGPEEVDDVVVENSFTGYGYGHGSAEDDSDSRTGRTISEKHHDHGTSSHNPAHTTDKESTNTTSIWDRWTILSMLRWRILPGIRRFHSLAFADPRAEAQYSREHWYSNKALALCTGAWLIFNWVLTVCLLTPVNTLDKVFYYGWLPLFNIPVPILIIFDWPRKRPILYQIFLTFTIWNWSLYNLFFLYFCGYYPGMHSHMSCGKKDFSAILYFASALPAIAVFALQWKRVPAMIGAVVFIVLAGVLVVPHKHSWSRNVVNILIFHTVLLYIHYMRESAERHLSKLRDQVKFQFKATQKAQVSERKAADSKRRVTSYIFHEVRVPLNTAMLALQNLEATLPTGDTEQVIEFKALDASLNILDFNRMDAGRFESVSTPYPFHKVIRASMVGLQLAADAKGLELVTEFDRNIDLVARAMLYREQGKSEEWIAWQLACNPDEDAEVTGDEMRLVQVVTNLTSNACKFTPPVPGGRVTVRTKLIFPENPTATLSNSAVQSPTSEFSPEPPIIQQRPMTDSTLATAIGEENVLSVNRLKGHDQAMQNYAARPRGRPTRPQAIVIRIEVQDTGVGIKPRDMIDNRLFSPYVQTEIGRHQGGKGTGLGLALVRHIVKLSGGRLGVQSGREGGSCFWVEIPLGIPKGTPETPRPTRITDPFPATPLPARDPFSRVSDVGTPMSEMTHSSTPSNFLDLRGPTVPSESLTDHIIDELPESAFPPAVILTTPTPGSKPSSPSPIAGPSRVPVSLFEAPSSSEPVIPPPIKLHSGTRSPHPVLTPDPPEQSPSLPSPSTSPSPPPPSLIQKNQSSFEPHDTPLSRPPLPGPTPTAPARPNMIRLPTQPVFNHSASEPNSAIPTKPSPGSRTPSWNPTNSLTGTNPIRALVVDDDPLTRRLMERMLNRIGCTVSTAENGYLALDMIKAGLDGQPTSFNYDVIFLDNQMPIMSGVAMVRKLREIGRKDFTVGITGNALKEDQAEYMEAGLDRVLTKPVLERSLREMLHHALDRRNSYIVTSSPASGEDKAPP